MKVTEPSRKRLDNRQCSVKNLLDTRATYLHEYHESIETDTQRDSWIERHFRGRRASCRIAQPRFFLTLEGSKSTRTSLYFSPRLPVASLNFSLRPHRFFLCFALGQPAKSNEGVRKKRKKRKKKEKKRYCLHVLYM